MEKKVLILFYSLSGSTKQMAEVIKTCTGADMVQIVEAQPYPKDFEKMVKKVNDDRKAGIDPAYKPVNVDVASYDLYFIGTPNWGGEIASPLETFLKDHDFSGKKILPFLSHGGGGEQNIEERFAALLPNSTITPAYVSYKDVEHDGLVPFEEWIYQYAAEIF